MKSSHKIIALLIVITAVIGGAFIVYESSDTISKNQLSLALSDELLPAQTNEFLDPTTLTPTHVESVESLSETLPYQKNATQEFAKKVAFELIEANPDGPSLLNGDRIIDAIDPKSLIDRIFSEELDGFNIQELKPLILPSSLNLTSQNNKASFEQYFEELQIILEKSLTISLNTNNPSLQDFIILANATSEAIKELHALQVPTQIAPLHTEQISLLTAQKNVFTALVRTPEDPLTALAAIQALPLLQEETIELQKKIDVFIAENNLII